jgi:RND superfamily putative drug exporter
VETFDHRTFPLARLVGRGRSVAVLLLGLVLAGAVLILAPAATQSTNASVNLPDDAESALAQQRLAAIPGGDDAPAIVVASRGGDRLSQADLAALGRLAGTLGTDLDTRVAGPVPSRDGTVALLTVPLAGDVSNEQNTERVEALRSDVRDGLPEGLEAQVTGAPAIQADLGAVFEGADVRLLLVTAAVVALLLIVTYRSPWLWLVPLAVIGLGDRVAAKVVEAVSAWSDVPIDGSTTGITSVLVFGAGTNYALLLIARYREELRRHEDRREAMRQAVGAAAPAILSSSGTVVLGLLTLLLADAPFVSRIGLAGAAGIAVAVVFALVVLPAAMSIPGRWLFWPFVPRVGDPDPSERGVWRRVGQRVTRRPVLVTVGGLVVLVLMALGTLGLRTGLAQDEQFLDTPESITAQQTLASAFPAGSSSPTTVVTTPRLAEQVARAAADVPDVRSAEVGRSGEGVAEVSVVLADEPASDAALRTVERLRAAVDDVDPDALVGGQDAQALDEADTAQRDRTVIIPVVLAVVLGMLLLLLRSVVAAVLLAGTTVLSYLSALGVGWLVFDHVLGWSATDVSTPLLGFIFLVALGVDYNIFLTARAREEMARTGDATGSIVTALAVTGGVITSAGILLAAVFAVLGVLPLVLLAQLGVLVGFGVLLDTVVVRGLVTPALVAWCGRRFWWPSRLSRPV